MRCNCGGEYREVTESRSFHIHGRKVTVDASFLRCTICDHAIWAPGQLDVLREKIRMQTETTQAGKR
jgi:uncharacterized protein with PIN domain